LDLVRNAVPVMTGRNRCNPRGVRGPFLKQGTDTVAQMDISAVSMVKQKLLNASFSCRRMVWLGFEPNQYLYHL